MSVQFIEKNNFPTYIAQASDIVSGSVLGTPLIGKTIYTWDDGAWYIITGASGSGYTTASYVMPALET